MGNVLMNLTVKEAQEQKVFVFDHDLNIHETTLYEHVMDSAELTTSPRGVGMKLHIRENSESFDNDGDVIENEKPYEVWSWGINGNNPRFGGECFYTEEEAEDHIFQQTYKFDFLPDDQRRTDYYHDYVDIFEEKVQAYSDIYHVDLDVSRSILHHEVIAENIQRERREKRIKDDEKERQRVFLIAKEYAKMIDKKDNESYKETAQRLSDSIGAKIESKVFHKAVKMVRNNVIV